MDRVINKLEDFAIVMNSGSGQIAIAKEDMPCGLVLKYNGEAIEIKHPVKKGQRFALSWLAEGEYVRQYGYAFGQSKGIARGELITGSNIANILPEAKIEDYKNPAETKLNERYVNKTFLGFKRKDDSVGTRNYYLIIPASMCASETALQVALHLDNDRGLLKKYPNLDGIVAVPHTEGCGCDAGLSIERLMRVLKGYVCHPNVGGCLIIDLGCEQTNYEKVHSYLEDVVRKKLRPIDWITIEKSGGINAARERADAIARRRIPEVAGAKREICFLEKLVVATECGASDSFSGITANPVIGNVVDKVISGKGAAILSEIPEMVGTFEMLLPRFRSLDVADKFKDAMNWYLDIAKRLGLTLEANLVPKNIEGGLINNYIKSLGAVLKGGTTVIEDVIDYAAPLAKRGLTIMQGPGSDPESVTGMVASGANIVCFSTGQGTPTGNVICPVIKVASNSAVFEKLSQDIDFNAGRLLTEKTDIATLGEELLEKVIEAASGKKTCAEIWKQRQFQIWTAGKLSL